MRYYSKGGHAKIAPQLALGDVFWRNCLTHRRVTIDGQFAMRGALIRFTTRQLASCSPHPAKYRRAAGQRSIFTK
jgi:hypothetical protein